MSLKIIPVLCNEKNMANYAYILAKGNTVAVIDAAEAGPVISRLAQLNLKPSFVLTTHHHFDHVGGNLELKQKYGVQIIAPAAEYSLIPGADIPAEEEKTLQLGDLAFTVINAPGHTKGHVLYYLPAEQKLFTGDVLFNLCVGGLFEGTPVEMYQTLQKIKALPETAEFFPGHEYTRSCLPANPESTPEFAAYLQKMLAREQGQYAPATLQEEKRFNLYLQAQTLTEFLGQE